MSHPNTWDDSCFLKKENHSIQNLRLICFYNLLITNPLVVIPFSVRKRT